MQRIFAAAAAVAFAAAGCSTNTARVETGPETISTQVRSTVPPGTTILTELDNTLSAKDNKVGDRFTMTVKEDVMNGSTILVPKGSTISGRVTGVDPISSEGDQAAIRLDFESLNINGRSHSLNAEVTDVDVGLTDRARSGDTRRDAAVGAAAGAVLGAVIGGSLKDILIGGVLGAGAGTIISLGRGDVESQLPRGTDMTLRTTQRIALR
jgi:hypothetical protein